MGLMPINGFGITLVGMKYQSARQIPIRWKLVMLSYVTTLRDWHVNLAVSLDVLMRWNVLYACLSSVSTADNSINSVSQITRLM
jgi:hypothetical protein